MRCVGRKLTILAFFAALPAILAGFFGAHAIAADLGATVSNSATVIYGPVADRVTLNPPPAVFVVEAFKTPSTIEFFRYAPSAPDALSVQINGSDFAPSTDPSGNPVFQKYGP